MYLRSVYLRRTRRLLSIAAALGLCACGGSISQPAAVGHHAGGEAHEHASLPPELDALHDVLAPAWHSEPGAERVTVACANAETLAARSIEVDSMVTPENVYGQPWSEGTARLVAAATVLATECASSGPAAEARLSDLHHAFHDLIEQVQQASGRADGQSQTVILLSE